MLATVIFSGANAQQEVRSHIKCHLQIQDQSTIIHQFVLTGQNKDEFVDRLTKKTVFMADGNTEQQIITVYECVDLNSDFKGEKVINIEKNSPF